jgi:hypothetical protein
LIIVFSPKCGIAFSPDLTATEGPKIVFTSRW